MIKIKGLKGVHYTRKELDKLTLGLIAGGKDLEFEVNGKKLYLDIKEYEASMRFSRPDLFI